MEEAARAEPRVLKSAPNAPAAFAGPLRRQRHRSRARRLDRRPGERPAQPAQRAQPARSGGVPRERHRDPVPAARRAHRRAAGEVRRRRRRWSPSGRIRRLSVAAPGVTARNPLFTWIHRRSAGPAAVSRIIARSTTTGARPTAAAYNKDHSMTFDLLDFAAHGLMPLPWWGYVVVALALTHVTIACVTIFLHRAQAHRALDLHPAVSHFFRFWLWLTTGMVTKEWVAIHRKHHAKVRDAGRPAQPADARHQDGASGAAPSSIAPSRRTRRRSRSTATARRTTGSSATSTRASRGRASA